MLYTLDAQMEFLLVKLMYIQDEVLVDRFGDHLLYHGSEVLVNFIAFIILILAYS